MYGKIRELVRRNVMPLLLSEVLVCAMLSIYDIPGFALWSLVSLCICVAAFALCEYVNTHRNMGTLYIIAAIAAALLLFGNVTKDIGYGRGFMQWLLTGESDDEKNCIIALLTVFPLLFSMSVYYFSNVLYRMGYLTLISLMPCVIYVKIVSEPDNIYLVFIALLNMGICIAHNYGRNKNERLIGGKNAIAAAVGFAFVVLMAVSLIPKEEEARYYDRFEAVFINGNTGLKIGENFSKLGETSGNADNYNELNNRRMYNVYGTDVPYLKRQTFDYYNFARDNWYPDKAIEAPTYTPYEWFERSSNLNLTALRYAMADAESYSPGFAEKYGLEQLIQTNDVVDTVNDIYIQALNFSAEYYLSTARCVSLGVMNSDDYYATKSGTFQTKWEQKHPSNIVYRVNTYNEFEVVDRWIELGGASFENDTEKAMLRELDTILTENDSPFAEAADAFVRLNDEAESYRNDCEKNTSKISDKMVKLARDITKDCTYDWEKAEALQNYFHDNDFIYDIEYTAEDTSPEYFLFKSKTGTCSDFASAYVLLARAAGLTVRYTEGYAPQQTDDPTMYTVSDKDSHAYPEVYIQNIGWLVYEPTVASRYNGFEDVSDDKSFSFWSLKPDTGLFCVIACMAALALVAMLAVRKGFPAVSEYLFMKRIGRETPAWCVLLVYKRIARKTVVPITGDNSNRTPYELAVCLDKLMGFDMYELAYLTETTVYGGVRPTEEDKRRTIEKYKELKGRIR
jgi:hypothetical protein